MEEGLIVRPGASRIFMGRIRRLHRSMICVICGQILFDLKSAGDEIGLISYAVQLVAQTREA